jgi:hypothetical protein
MGAGDLECGHLMPVVSEGLLALVLVWLGASSGGVVEGRTKEDGDAVDRPVDQAARLAARGSLIPLERASALGTAKKVPQPLERG